MEAEYQNAQIAKYLKLRETRSRLKKVYEAHDEGFEAEQLEIEKEFVGMLKTTQGSVSLTAGRAHHKIQNKIQIASAADMYAFIAEDPAARMSLLQQRVAVGNHDTIAESLGVSLLPGLRAVQEHRVIFSKSTKTTKKKV